MAKKFSVLRAGMSAPAREKADRKAKAMQVEMPLHELGQARGLSQKMLAEVLHVQQPSIPEGSVKINNFTDLGRSVAR
jgi:predicted XRE-type DNA-binding protein